jgi:uncharacterized protein YgiM (DUF1202 family)
MNTCINCKTTQEENNKFCIKCGKNILQLKKTRKNVKKLLLSFLLLSTISLVCYGVYIYHEKTSVKYYGVVVATKLNVRETKDKEAANNLLGFLTLGERVSIIGYEDGWRKIKFNDKFGYVSDDLIWPIGEFKAFQLMVSTALADSAINLSSRAKSELLHCDRTIGAFSYNKDTSNFNRSTNLQLFKADEYSSSILKGQFYQTNASNDKTIPGFAVLLSNLKDKTKEIKIFQTYEHGDYIEMAVNYKAIQGNFKNIFKINKGDFVYINGIGVEMKYDAIGINFADDNLSSKILIPNPKNEWHEEEFIIAEVGFDEGC